MGLYSQVEKARGRLRIPLRDAERRGIKQFDGGEAGGHKLRERGGRPIQVVEDQEAGGKMRQGRHGAKRGFGDERESSLTTDDQVEQDLECGRMIDKRV